MSHGNQCTGSGFQKSLSSDIHKCKLKLQRTEKKPYVNTIQKKYCLLWIKGHLKWSEAKWKTVLWNFAESKFEILFGKNGWRVARTEEQKDHSAFYQRSVYTGFWATFSSNQLPHSVNTLLILTRQCYNSNFKLEFGFKYTQNGFPTCSYIFVRYFN